MCDHEVPVGVEDVADIASQVAAGSLGGDEVAGPSGVAQGDEGIAHDAGELAGDEDAHQVSGCPPSSAQWQLPGTGTTHERARFHRRALSPGRRLR